MAKHVRVVLDLDFEEAIWAAEYGLPVAEAASDATNHLAVVVVDALGERARQMGTWRVRFHESFLRT